MKCPQCGTLARRQKTRYGTRNSCGPCGLWSWGDKPLVDAETHEARQAAHEAFDVLWKKEGMNRSEAYRLLAVKMKMPREACHMARMSKETARKVPAAVEKIRKARA